jgi:23S rRNA (cytidine1920-2'-O)/16S rRNA (cytidine1409-2'-O)-methyltransferase
LKHFNIDVSGLSALDVGASTGGFTDCLLKSGAGSVVSIDVGYGQFAWELRQDPRVKLMERTNIRHVTLEDIGTPCDFAAIDVSFISLKLVLPVVKNLIKESGKVVCLIKPQFEAGRDKVGKKGVVRDPAVHKEVISNIVDFSSSIGFSIAGLSYSPIRGPEGNIEYLLYLINCSRKDTIDKMDDYIEEIIKQSHEEI